MTSTNPEPMNFDDFIYVHFYNFKKSGFVDSMFLTCDEKDACFEYQPFKL